MAITKKPVKSKSRMAPPAAAARVSNGRDVEAVIAKGGSMPMPPPQRDWDEHDQEFVPFVCRAPRHLLRQVDEAAKSRQIRISRQTWMLEAIYEKVDREKSING